MQPVPVPQNARGDVAPVQYRQEPGRNGRLVASATTPVPGAYIPGSAHKPPAMHATHAVAQEAMQAQMQANRAAGRPHTPIPTSMPITPQPLVPATHKAAAVVGARAPLGQPAPAPAPIPNAHATVTHTNNRAPLGTGLKR